MKRKIATLYLDTNEDNEKLEVEWEEDIFLKEQLGILEWAKAIVFEGVKIDNALSTYQEEEL